MLQIGDRKKPIVSADYDKLKTGRLVDDRQLTQLLECRDPTILAGPADLTQQLATKCCVKQVVHTKNGLPGGTMSVQARLYKV